MRPTFRRWPALATAALVALTAVQGWAQEMPPEERERCERGRIAPDECERGWRQELERCEGERLNPDACRERLQQRRQRERELRPEERERRERERRDVPVRPVEARRRAEIQARQRAEAARRAAAQRAAAARRPTFVPPAVRRRTLGSPAVRRPTFVAPTVRRPSFVAPTVRRPSFVAPTVRRPSFVAPTVRRPTLVPPTVLRPTPRPATGWVGSTLSGGLEPIEARRLRALSGAPQLAHLLGKPAGIWSLGPVPAPTFTTRIGGVIGKLAKNPGPRRCAGESRGTLVSITQLKRDHDRDVQQGRKPPGEKFGPELELPVEAHQAYCRLLPDLRAYVTATWRNISPLFYQGRRPSPDEVAAIARGFFQYGCRQIGRFLPGYARRVQVRRGGVETTGRWTAEIPSDQIREEIKTRGGGAATRPSAPASDRKDLVEVCIVTHPQLEATLRGDIDQLTAQAHREIRPVASASAPTPLGFSSRDDAGTLSKKVEALLTRHQGLLQRARGSALPRLSGFAGLGTGGIGAVRATVGRFTGTAAAGTMTTATITPSKYHQLRQILLHGDLKNVDPNLSGVNLNTVVGRLVGFYRKGAEARNFAQAKDHGKRQEKWEDAAPPQAQGEVRHQSAAIPPRTQREVLRRAVNQWTDAYEYDSLKKHLSSARAPGLTEIYKAAEALELYRFWTNCSETRAICQAPTLPLERQWCQFCAVRAVQTHCLKGKQSYRRGGRLFTQCFAWGVPRSSATAAGASYLLNTGPGTLESWLSGQAAAVATSPGFQRFFGKPVTQWNDAVAHRLFVTRLFPAPPPPRPKTGSVRIENEIRDEGWRHLGAVPLSEWQRCALLKPGLSAGASECDPFSREGASLRKWFAKQPRSSWRVGKALLFRTVFASKHFLGAQAQARKNWQKCRNRPNTTECKGNDAKRLGDGPSYEAAAQREIAAQLKKQSDEKAEEGLDGPSVANTIVDGASPILGTLLSMLLEYAGLTDVMKTLARAAGMTPEQSADCEDPEYRRETMGLSAAHDNKGDCLMRVFAKNFVNALEGMIVMLGNKLVDWGVDALRTALQGVKSAAVAAAGSVPFAGGFLAMMVDVLWEVVLNYGAKALLKGFVVAKLPEWLQIRKLASKPLKEILSNPGPIVRVVAGIILQLIDSALKYGKENWVAAGAATVMNGIRIALERLVGRKNPAAYFWIRALIYAKKEVLREVQGGQDIGAQLLGLGRALVSGIASVIERRLGAPIVQQRFRRAVTELKDEVLSASGAQRFFERIISDLQRGDLKSLGRFVGQKLVPIVVPTVLSFADLPQWARDALGKVAVNLFDGFESAGGGNWKPLLKELTDLGHTAGRHLVDAVPFSDPALKKLALQGVDAIASIFRDPAGFWRRLNANPLAMINQVLGPVQSYLFGKLTTLLPKELGPERKHLPRVITGLLSFLQRRTTPDFAATMRWLVGELGPYAKERAALLTRGAPIAGLVDGVLGWALGPKGPLLSATAKLDDLIDAGGDIVTRLFQTVKGYLTAGARGARILGGFVQRLLAALARGMRQPPSSGRDLLGWIADILGLPRNATTNIATARRLVQQLEQGLRADADAFAVLGPTVDAIGRALQGPDALKVLAGKSVADLLSTLWDGLPPLLTRLAQRLVADRPLANLLGEGLGILVRYVGLRSRMGVQSGPLRDVKWSAWTIAVRMASRYLLGRVRELVPANLAPLGRLLERGWERLLSFALARLNMGTRAWTIASDTGASLLRSVVGDVLGALEELAVGAAPTQAVRHLIGGLFTAVKTVLEDPAGFVQAVQKDAAGTLLPMIPMVLQGFLYETVLEPLRAPCKTGQRPPSSPPGRALSFGRISVGRNTVAAGTRPVLVAGRTSIQSSTGRCREETAPSMIVKALLDGALWILHEPHKRFTALLRDLNGKPAQLIKRIVGTLGKALVEKIESPLPKDLLLGAMDFVVNQWQPGVRR